MSTATEPRRCIAPDCANIARRGVSVCQWHGVKGVNVPEPQRRLSPGDSAHVQFRCAQAVRLAVLSRADAQGLTEREAWETAGREWASRG